MDLVRKMLEKRFIAQNLCKIQSNTGETIYCASFWLLAFVIAVKKNDKGYHEKNFVYLMKVAFYETI